MLTTPPASADLAALDTRNLRRRRRSRLTGITAAATAVALFASASAWALSAPPPSVMRPSPTGTRLAPDPAITTFADSITASPLDHATGRWTYITTRTTGREYTDTLTVSEEQHWTADDGSGGWNRRSYPLPLTAYRDTTVRDAVFDGLPRVGVYGFPPLRRPMPPEACPQGSVMTNHIIGVGGLTQAKAATTMGYVAGTQYRTAFLLDCRKALLRTLAALNGPTLTGHALDPLGRAGTAIDLASDGVRQRLIFDTATGTLLAHVAYLDGDPRNSLAPGIYICAVYLAFARTDALPAEVVTPPLGYRATAATGITASPSP
jgi:hypothetical protein